MSQCQLLFPFPLKLLVLLPLLIYDISFCNIELLIVMLPNIVRK